MIHFQNCTEADAYIVYASFESSDTVAETVEISLGRKITFHSNIYIYIYIYVGVESIYIYIFCCKYENLITEIFFSESDVERLRYLENYSHENDERIEEYWTDTHACRRQIFRIEQITVDAYLTRFKPLREKVGSDLVCFSNSNTFIIITDYFRKTSAKLIRIGQAAHTEVIESFAGGSCCFSNVFNQFVFD